MKFTTLSGYPVHINPDKVAFVIECTNERGPFAEVGVGGQTVHLQDHDRTVAKKLIRRRKYIIPATEGDQYPRIAEGT